MLIGVPKEIKNHEYRVGLTPAGVRELVGAGHEVLIENNAGLAIGLTNEQYLQAGAKISGSAQEVFAQSEMIIKVKEPQANECKMLRPGQLLFTYLHLAADQPQTDLLLASGASCIAYETVTDDHGGLPLLAPMSEVAGRLAPQEGAGCLKKALGGSGILMGGVPGVASAHVTVIGGGVVGLNAARIALGMGANVTILDRSLSRLKEIDDLFGDRINTLYSTEETLLDEIKVADMVIGAVLIPGAAAPKLISRNMLKTMKPGSVLVDVAIDQGGCFETSKATTHQDPTFEVEGVIHYCVANMPGAVARTSTFALTNATLPYALQLANKGLDALASNGHLLKGLNVHAGKLTCKAVANAFDYDFVESSQALGFTENVKQIA